MDEQKYTIPTREYTIDKTTKVQREKIINEALAMTSLGGTMPTSEAMNLTQEYIDGYTEIPELIAKAIAMYDKRSSDEQ